VSAASGLDKYSTITQIAPSDLCATDASAQSFVPVLPDPAVSFSCGKKRLEFLIGVSESGLSLKVFA
jgi:hypothetical protein